jgi:hypothetical protein
MALLERLPGGRNPSPTADSLALHPFNRVDYDSILSSMIIDEFDVKHTAKHMRNKDLGFSFFRTRDFHNARRFFSSRSEGSDQSQDQILNIRLSLAETYLYNGNYHETWRLLKKPQYQVTPDKSRHCRLIIEISDFMSKSGLPLLLVSSVITTTP